MSFGEKLKAARKRAGLRQREVAEAMGWGAAQNRISQYEAGLREPTLDVIKDMARFLGIPPEELAFDSVGLSEDELALIQAWRLADQDGKDTLRSQARMILLLRRTKSPHLQSVKQDGSKKRRA